MRIEKRGICVGREYMANSFLWISKECPVVLGKRVLIVLKNSEWWAPTRAMWMQSDQVAAALEQSATRLWWDEISKSNTYEM